MFKEQSIEILKVLGLIRKNEWVKVSHSSDIVGFFSLIEYQKNDKNIKTL